MCSARSCWPCAWARRASSPRPAPACMASPPRRCAPSSACPASSIWARSTSNGRSRTCCACACSAPRCAASPPVRRTLKDAMNEALRDWVTNVADTFYCIGTVAGPHPYPAMVRDFQSIIGRETREQMQEAEGRLPDSLVACIGGGSNAMGLFHPFLDERGIEIYGVEAAGHGLPSGKHAASIAGGRPGVLHGNRTYLADGRRRPDRGGAFDFRRPRLSRHRAGARLAQRHGPGEIPVRHRRRGGGGVPALQQARGHHPGAGTGACARPRRRPRAAKARRII